MDIRGFAASGSVWKGNAPARHAHPRLLGGCMCALIASRRDFLKITGAGVAGTALTSAAPGYLPILGANDRVRVAVCGVRGRGNDHIRGFARVPGTEIAALCDVDENVLNQRLGEVEKRGLPKPKSYIDVRKLLEDKTIDAISIATPNHWHALMAIWGCQAGKDVYVEKPCSHNLWEGRQLVKAAARYNRMVQHGTQIRSATAIREGIQKVHDGYLGEAYMARGICFKWRDTIGRAKEEAVPEGVHYDLWTGPAPARPFTKNRFHYNWHWNYTFGNGFFGSKGYMSTGDEGATTYKVWMGREQQPEPSVHEGDQVQHFKNFIDCVISRKKEDLHAPAEEGHMSCAMMHLANASYRL